MVSAAGFFLFIDAPRLYRRSKSYGQLSDGARQTRPAVSYRLQRRQTPRMSVRT
jgi:hypothetical protein